MPGFVINTNLARDKIPANFVSELSKQVSKLTGKPESYVVVQINADQIMSFGGSTELCALCTLGNVGRVDIKAFSKGIMTLIQSQLGIPGDRMYVFFSTLGGSDVGFNMSTF